MGATTPQHIRNMLAAERHLERAIKSMQHAKFSTWRPDASNLAELESQQKLFDALDMAKKAHRELGDATDLRSVTREA